MKNNEQSERVPVSTKVLILFAFVSLVVAIGAYAFQFGGQVSNSQEVWGQFGDYLGGVLNSFFGLGGFVALLLTLHYQKAELKRSTQQNNQQYEILKTQGFESTYFQLLGLYRDVLSDLRMTRSLEAIDNPNSPGEVIGRDCFRYLYNTVLRRYIEKASRGDSTESLTPAIATAYVDFYKEHGHLVGHYFRTLYNILMFVEDSDFSSATKKRYANLLRAQLSRYELAFLFYNCATEYGKGIVPLVKRFKILKHLEVGALFDEVHLALQNDF